MIATLFPRHAPVPGARPPRLRRGVTLVELMIAMLILAIVCIAWLEIIGIQSARREARRREAVERLAGMMDAFMYCYKAISPRAGTYYLKIDPAHPVSLLTKESFGDPISTSASTATISYRFNDHLIDPDALIPKPDLLNLDPIGYRLVVVQGLNAQSNPNSPDGAEALFGGQKPSSTAEWKNQKWLIGLLYDHQGNMSEAGKPFFRLPVCLGMQ